MSKVKKLPSGKYNIRVYLGRDEDGKVISKSFTGSDKTLLKSQASEYERTHKGKERDVFGAMLERYIKARKAFLSPSTVRGYESQANHLKTRYPAIFEAPVADLDRKALQTFALAMQQDELSVKTMRNYLGLISAVLNDSGITMPKIRLPERAPRKVYSPTIEQIQAIIQASKGTRMEIPVMLGICGLRRGEICALDLDHIDGQAVKVEYDLVYGSGKKLQKKEPKTPQSVRTVYIPKETADLIRKQGYVVDMSPDRLTLNFVKLIERNKLPKCRFHDLRRFYAAYMHGKGFTDAQIMEAGGWKTDNIMKSAYRYALTDDDVRKEMADSIGALDFV